MSTNIRYFRAGQCIFKEGDEPTCLYLIKKGTVTVRRIKAGEYVELAKLHSNEVLGELSFFDRRPRSASAFAMSEVEVMEISFEALDAIYAKVPDYLKSIIVSVADRLRKANDTIRRLQKNTIPIERKSRREKELEEAISGAENSVMDSEDDSDTVIDSDAASSDDDSQ